MKLIKELVEDVQYILEEKDGKKELFIEGVFLQSNLKNRNGRVYPKEIMAKEVARYTEDCINKNRALGELGHPDGPTVNLDRVSHMIVSLKEDGDNWIGKAKVLDTPMGKIAAGLIEAGCQLGVSSRGLGSIREKSGISEVQDDFMLATAGDIVADPSAPNAFVRGIMEGTEWIYDVASGSWRAQNMLDRIHEETKSMTREQLEENAMQLFNKFIKSITE